MKFARRAGKRDALEPEVVRIAEAWGWKVIKLDCWDLQCHRRGWQLSVEVKTGNAPLTKSQQKLIEDGWPLYVVRTVEEAQELFA